MKNTVFTAICFIAILGIAMSGWTPYYTTPDISMDIAPLGENSACIVGGYSNTPMGVYCSINNSYQQFERVELINPSFMFVALSIAPNGAAATTGAGFQFLNSSSVMYAHHLLQGDAFRSSSASNEIISQDIKYVKTSEYYPHRTRFAVVGDFDAFSTQTRDQGVIFSYDGGVNFNNTIKWDDALSELTAVRYGDYPDANTFYVTGGHWPSSPHQEMQDIKDRCIRMSEHICQPRPHLSQDQIRYANSRVYRDNTLAKALGKDGYFGVITRTTDGGKTWKAVFEVDGLYFNDISCSTSTNCVAVGEGGGAYIYATQDGVNWSRVYELESLYMASLFRVRFATPTVAYASGGYATDDRELVGVILKSTDAGKTWNIDATQNGVGIFTGLNFGEDGKIGFTVGATNEGRSVMMRYEE